MNVGRAIKEVRNTKGLGQIQVAGNAGISQTAYSQIETGASEPTKRTLAAICVALDTSVSLIAVLAIDENDVSPAKKEAYKTIFPAVKELMMELLKGDKDEIIK
jgi:transcriptional regulator with XRE-family HTH domain